MSTFNNAGTGLRSSTLAAAWQEIVTKLAENLGDLSGVTLTYNYSLAQGQITGTFSMPSESFQEEGTPKGAFMLRPKTPSSAYLEDGETLKSNLVGSDASATGDVQGPTILHQFFELMEQVNRAEIAENPTVTGGVSFSYNGDTEVVSGNYINPVTRTILSDGAVKISAIDYLS